MYRYSNFDKIFFLTKTNPTHVLVLAILALTWGSSFILMKRGLADAQGNPIFSPDQVASLRLTIAGISLLPLSLPVFRKIPWKDLKWILLVGLTGSGIPAFLFTHSQKFLDSSIAGILNSLTPLFTLLIGVFIFKRSSNSRQISGVVLGLVGAVGLISLRGFGNSDNWMFSLLIVAGTVCYGLSVNIVQAKLAHLKALRITALAQLFLVIPAITIALSTGVPEVITTHPKGLESFGYIAILALAGTALANILYFWLTQQTTALFASSVTYLMPLVAVGWGLVDHEILTVYHLLCGLLILAGVYLVNYRKS